MAPLRQIDWVVYAMRPFSGPNAVLTYLTRYTHRVAISNSRLIAGDAHHVTFKYKDYRAKPSKRYKTLRLTTDEFLRRFLLHILPSGFHRIRHFGFFANPVRAHTLAQIRALLLDDTTETVQTPCASPNLNNTDHSPNVCPVCGASMSIIETLNRTTFPRAPPAWPGH